MIVRPEYYREAEYCTLRCIDANNLTILLHVLERTSDTDEKSGNKILQLLHDLDVGNAGEGDQGGGNLHSRLEILESFMDPYNALQR